LITGQININRLAISENVAQSFSSADSLRSMMKDFRLIVEDFLQQSANITFCNCEDLMTLLTFSEPLFMDRKDINIRMKRVCSIGDGVINSLNSTVTGL